MASWSSSLRPSNSSSGRRTSELRTTSQDDSDSATLGAVPRAAFNRELEMLRESLLRMAGLVESQIDEALRPEFGLMGELASQQIRDILDALIEENADQAREVAAKDDEIDRLYHRVFEALIEDMGNGTDAEDALRAVTLINVAHNLERI